MGANAATEKQGSWYKGEADVALAAANVGERCHPKRDKPELGYGTAGFRTKADILDHVMYRMGILAALRSQCLQGKAVGVMITASHNPECDNGVKLVDPLGEMLPIDWEARATKIANAADADLAQVVRDVSRDVGADKTVKAHVIVGRDTRASSSELALAVLDGVGAVQPSSVWSLGVVSTPQLHYVVRCHNTQGEYGKPSLEGYFEKLVGAFAKFIETIDAAAIEEGNESKFKACVCVDGANGVGAKVMETAIPLMNERLPSLKRTNGKYSIRAVNCGEGGLNEGCGADFVKVQQKGPAGMQALSADERGVSFDGDADRIVYFCYADNKFALLDGDRIATLLADYISKQLALCKLVGLRLGIVQTAYANGASTVFAAKQIPQENIVCAKTGVKHLHHEAKEMDVGVYFEANGHGTVVFSDNFVKKVEGAAANPETSAPARCLLLLREIINETVGDAFSDFLAVEAVLYATDRSAQDWFALYTDLPNRQLKVTVKDRGIFETTNAERTCVKPAGLQAAIDELVKTTPGGRSFVRPSGTEDVVRVYAEADTQTAMEDLGRKVSQAVYDLAGGVGERP